MNKMISFVKDKSLIIIPALLFIILMSHCSKTKYKNLADRYLIQSTEKMGELKTHIDSCLQAQKIDILLLEKEYDTFDSTIFSLKKRLDVSH